MIRFAVDGKQHAIYTNKGQGVVNVLGGPRTKGPEELIPVIATVGVDAAVNAAAIGDKATYEKETKREADEAAAKAKKG